MLWILGIFLPWIGFVLLLIVSDLATKAIRAAGFRVTLMGADLSEIQRALPQKQAGTAIQPHEDMPPFRPESVVVHCPFCGAELPWMEEAQGQQVACGACDREFTYPRLGG